MTNQLSPEDAALLIKKSYDDPVFFAKYVLGVDLWDKQVQIIESIRDNANTCVASGHGVGKTFISAVATLWFLCTHDQSRIITTAPTNRQVEAILWAEIWHLYKHARFPLGGKLLKTSLTIEEKWFALGLSTDDPDRFQGHHARHVLLVMDEAPGIDPKIYEAAQGILTQASSKNLLIGNPTSPSGPFFDAFHNKLWNSFYISCYDSPAIAEPDRYPALTTQKWIDERKEEWGETSPMFVSRVLGQFPLEGEDTLIPLNWCNRAVARFEKSKDTCKVSDHVYLGLDVARYGTNKTVLSSFVPNRLQYQKSIQNKSTTEATKLAITDGISAGAKLMQITTDDTGVGGGVTDRLRELGYPVLAINFSQKPTDPMHFRGIRDEMYWHLRELFRSEEIAIPNSEALINQLSAIKYKINSKGKIEIEDKDAMKKRGLNSPDEADSLVIAVWGAKRMKASGQFRRRAMGRSSQYKDVAYY